MTRDQAQAVIIQKMMQGFSFDYRYICSRLAETDPELFLKLSMVQETWVPEAKEFFARAEAVPCIKAIRVGADIGLWEAKQIYDRLRSGGTLPCEDYRWSDLMEKTYQMMR